jgi:hypothetical protein
MGTKQFDNYADLITFTRASGGTALRPISYGSELVTNGTFDSDTDWTLESGWSISGGTLNGSSTGNDAYQTITCVVGKTYFVSYEITSYTSGQVFVKITQGGSQDSTAPRAQSVGSYTHTFVAKTTSVVIALDGIAAQPFAGSIDNISVKEVLFDQPNAPLTLFNHPTNIPRIEYDADGNRLGLLVEEQRTNLALRSEEFNSWWVRSGVDPIQPNVVISPSGELTADKIVTSNSLTQQKLRSGSSFSLSTVYTFSVYAKAAELSVFSLNFGNLGAHFRSFDLSLGTTAGTGVGSITFAGNGWYKCSWTQETAASSGAAFFYIYLSPSLAAVQGDGTSGVYIWGAQLEAGAFPTSYIPTSGSTATRAADVASIPTNAFGYNASEGTVVCEFQTAVPLGARGNEGIFSIEEDADNLHRAYLPASDAINWQFKSGGSSVFADAVTASFAPNVFSKAAIAFESGSQVSSFNGAAITTHGTSTATQPDATTLKIGYINTADMLGGHIKSIKYYPRRLSNAQLQELTQ